MTTLLAQQAPLTEIGIGGILAILLIREAFGFVSRRNGTKGSAVTREELTEQLRMVQFKDNCEQIVKRIDERLDSIQPGRAQGDGP